VDDSALTGKIDALSEVFAIIKEAHHLAFVKILFKVYNKKRHQLKTLTFAITYKEINKMLHSSM